MKEATACGAALVAAQTAFKTGVDQVSGAATEGCLYRLTGD